MSKRFHLNTRSGRTSVCLDRYLAELLALPLGVQSDHPQAQGAVPTGLQGRYDQDPGAFFNASHRLARLAIEAIADNALSEGYWRWRLREVDTTDH